MLIGAHHVTIGIATGRLEHPFPAFQNLHPRLNLVVAFVGGVVWVWLALTASCTHCGGAPWPSNSVIVVVGASSFDAHVVKLCCNRGTAVGAWRQGTHTVRGAQREVHTV